LVSLCLPLDLACRPRWPGRRHHAVRSYRVRQAERPVSGARQSRGIR
jgi:hypothetical protein